MSSIWVVASIILTTLFFMGIISLYKVHVQSNIRSLGEIVKRCNETLDNVLYESRLLRETTKNTLKEISSLRTELYKDLGIKNKEENNA